jgi:ATP-binding cassette subfamily E protein 1
MRIAVLNREKCVPLKCGWLCIKVCPGVRMGDKTIEQGPEGFPILAEQLCTGCGLCVKKCPVGAITIINLPEAIGRPLHQYGVNGFRIFNMPVPRQGVVGLIGPNGIGKSTVLKILAGHLVPNLGNIGGEGGHWASVLEQYKGHEVFKYVEQLSEKRVKLSYKPQEVGKLADTYDDAVSGLLKKVDERGVVPELVKELELANCLDQKLSEVSGGELQRIAIAATAAKKADFYFFDEPSSYLDIRQRLRMARVIRKLGETASVFVVEHDLAVLDYLTDFVHIFFGKSGAYGIISGIKTGRSGINEYLDGFLKAENMRIREYSIRFAERPPASEWKGKKSYSYGEFAKKYPGFTMKAKEGEFKKGEVVGILGPNAIGKSTYMKVLAGIETADQGDPGLGVKISYKPQYIALEYDGTVTEMIGAEGNMDREFFYSELMKYVDDLLEKRVDGLSGGESQRLAIAVALAKEADVCLLDEPSAFLDIEQRLRLAQLIKRMTEKKEITTLVIDHDIVFEDAIANRLMVFEGVPGKRGTAGEPQPMRDGMNAFLKDVEITMRRDKESGRPRINKQGSQKDDEQKNSGEYYYSL